MNDGVKGLLLVIREKGQNNTNVIQIITKKQTKRNDRTKQNFPAKTYAAKRSIIKCGVSGSGRRGGDSTWAAA